MKTNHIQLKANAPGQVILSMDMVSSKGSRVQCSKVVDVLRAPEAGIKTYVSGCDIAYEGLKEAKVSEGVASFTLVKVEDQLQYEWAADYDNGDRKISTENSAQFDYSKQNGIKTVTLKMVSSKCTGNITKTFDANYWQFY